MKESWDMRISPILGNKRVSPKVSQIHSSGQKARLQGKTCLLFGSITNQTGKHQASFHQHFFVRFMPFFAQFHMASGTLSPLCMSYQSQTRGDVTVAEEMFVSC
jgi:hypothetical protein